MPDLYCEHCGQPTAIAATSQFFSYGIIAAVLCSLCMREHDAKLDTDGLADRLHENRILTDRLGQSAELFDADGHEITADRAVANSHQIRTDMLAAFAGWFDAEPVIPAAAK